MTNAVSEFEGGFTDTVIEAQSTFHAAMTALSRPGTIARLPNLAQPPAPANAATGALALTLFDADTPVFLGPTFCQETIIGWLRFHTNAPITHERQQARFAILDTLQSLQSLECFALGTHEYPDRSTTVIIQTSGFDGAPNLRLSGPGIDGLTNLSIDAETAGFVSTWQRNTALFPRGIDVILAAPDALVALPRTTQITVIGAP